ncbi:uncharacterized protein LY89DRAFT_97612 [Mollisia scopiformis]|uniref:MARVEL domain-containing protein n=1 Tax=Mollisia scopiformis TaxID=149040 RepID=A0A194X6R9_MOLSC|nr:uncharacterized protein LY89DRAFT_97612 [Mollisia scopiformis]KUJ15873.1 hypothetical protein LY89DRAFT_97612 [Mollisia scopiformis]
MILEDLLSLLLRIGELAFTAVVAGLTGEYLHNTRSASAWSRKRFIYTEVIAAIGILFSLLFLLPFMASFVHWPMDFLLFAGLMIAFGLLAHYISPSCGSIWNWHGIANGGSCDKFKADLAFLFMGSIFFLASALLGLYVMHKYRARADAGARRGWYRRRARV